MHREPEVLEAEVQVEKWLDCRARITSKELAQLHSVKSGILQSACSTSQKMDADSGKSALMHIARLMNSPAKGLTKWWQKYSGYVENCTTINWVAYLKRWSCRSLHRFCGRAQTYWSQSDVFDSPKPCYVMPTFRDQNPSLGTCVSPPEMHSSFVSRSRSKQWREQIFSHNQWGSNKESFSGRHCGLAWRCRYLQLRVTANEVNDAKK